MNAALQAHQRTALLANARFPKTEDTTPQSMRRVLQALATHTTGDGMQSKFRPLDPLEIARSIGSSTRVVANALIALESQRVITRMRSGDQVTVCINWCTLQDFVPQPSTKGVKP